MRCGRSLRSTKLIENFVRRLSERRVERARERQRAVVRRLQRPRHVDALVQVAVLEHELGPRQTDGLLGCVDVSFGAAAWRALAFDLDDDRRRPLARVLTQPRERLSCRVGHFAVVAVPDVPGVEVVLRSLVLLDRAARRDAACARHRREWHELNEVGATRPAPGSP